MNDNRQHVSVQMHKIGYNPDTRISVCV